MQSFNDGIVKIYKSETGQNLTLIQTLRYTERTVGYNRFYKALERDIEIDLIIRCPRIEILRKDTDILVAVLNGENRYRVIQIQFPEDKVPPVMDLTLEKVSEYADVSVVSDAQFNCEIDVYGKLKGVNEIGEIYFNYSKIKSIWAEITAETGTIKNSTGNSEYAEISHKFIVKSNEINITNDMYFIFEEKRYDVKYFLPNYKYKDVIEVFCSMVIG